MTTNHAVEAEALDAMDREYYDRQRWAGHQAREAERDFSAFDAEAATVAAAMRARREGQS